MARVHTLLPLRILTTTALLVALPLGTAAADTHGGPQAPAGFDQLRDPSEPTEPPEPTPPEPTPTEEAVAEEPDTDPPGPRLRQREVVVALDDHAETVQGEAVQIPFADNDIYPGQRDLRAHTHVSEGPTSGSAELDELDLLLLYIPHPDFTGTDRFEYTTCDVDGDAGCDSATVTVEVHPAATHPEPQADENSLSRRSGPGLSGPCGGRLAWGGHENGRIPAEALTAIGGPHQLEAVAAEAFLRMRAAARADGVELRVTDSYRSYAGQVSVRRRKGHLVATAEPGTSVHGWGRALDLAAPPSVYAWLDAFAADFGWVNPAWAKRPGRSFEPWHWEHIGTDDDCTAGSDPDGAELEQVAASMDLDAPDRRGRVVAVALGLAALQLAAVGGGVHLWRRRQR